MVKVNPADLRFTQDSIASHFKDPHHYFSIHDAVKHIQRGQMNPDDFPMLCVMSYNGCLWSLDNRRLWVFRMAQCSEITVKMVTKMHPRLEAIANYQSRYKKLSSPEFLPRVRGNPNTYVEGISSNVHPRVQDVMRRRVATKSPQRVLRETTGNKLGESFLPPPDNSQGLQPVLVQVNISNAKVTKVERPLLHPQGSVSVDTTTSVLAEFAIQCGSLDSNGNEPVLPALSQSLGRRDSTLYKSSNVDDMCPDQTLLLNGAHLSQVGERASVSVGQVTSVDDGGTANTSTVWWLRFLKNRIYGCFGIR